MATAKEGYLAAIPQLLQFAPERRLRRSAPRASFPHDPVKLGVDEVLQRELRAAPARGMR